MNNIMTTNVPFILKMMEVSQKTFSQQEMKSLKQNDSVVITSIKEKLGDYIKEARKQLTPEQLEMTVFSDFSGEEVVDVMSQSIRPIGKKGKFMAVCMMAKPENEFATAPSIIVSGTMFQNKKIDMLKIWSACGSCQSVESMTQDVINKAASYL